MSVGHGDKLINFIYFQLWFVCSKIMTCIFGQFWCVCYNYIWIDADRNMIIIIFSIYRADYSRFSLTILLAIGLLLLAPVVLALIPVIIRCTFFVNNRVPCPIEYQSTASSDFPALFHDHSSTIPSQHSETT